MEQDEQGQGEGLGAQVREDAGVEGAYGVEATKGPLYQFEIKEIVPIEIAGLDLSFTNSALYMLIAAGLVLALVFAGARAALIPGRLQSVVELLYEFVAGMVRDNVGKEGMPYFAFFFGLFSFILFGNLVGMVPGSFTFTSHIVATLAMGMIVIIGVTAIGIMKHGLHFFSFFVPAGVPGYMVPIMVPIEVLSYLIRPFSLAVRLAVNMTAGHIMLKVFAGFVTSMGAATFFVGGLAPLLLVVGLTALELLIAVIQAYVFTILSVMYLRDAVHLH